MSSFPRIAALLLLCVAPIARGEDPSPVAPAAAGAASATPAATAPGGPDAAGAGAAAVSPTGAIPRVRASHRVDVIAPGERVETVIDRLRATSGAAGAPQRPQGGAPPARATGGDGRRWAPGRPGPGRALGPGPAAGIDGARPGAGPGPVPPTRR